jgi:hypothetical protein
MTGIFTGRFARGIFSTSHGRSNVME